MQRRHLVWTNVTANPTADWIARQITEAFPWEQAPHYMIRDRDASYRHAGGRMALLHATSVSRSTMGVADGRTIAQRTPTSQPDDENARCKASRAADPPNDFSQPMPPSTTPST